jgi:SOS regulatory protein LexA
MATKTVDFVQEGDEILKALATVQEMDGKVEIPEIIQCLIKMADDFRKQKMLDCALNCCEQGRQLTIDKIWDDYGDVRKDLGYAEGLVMMHLGTVYLTCGEDKFDQALNCYSRSRNSFHKLNRRYSEAIAWMAQGRIHVIRRHWFNALKHYQLSLNAFGSSGFSPEKISELRKIIEDQFEEARAEYLSGLVATANAVGGAKKAARHDEPKVTSFTIPVVGRIAAGDALLAVENIEDYIGIDLDHAAGATFALRVQGNSMINARIQDQDYVLVRQQPRVDNGEIAAVLIDGFETEGTLKRFHDRQNHIFLQPENDEQKPIVVILRREDERSVRQQYEDKKMRIDVKMGMNVSVVGKVVGVLRIME